MTEQQNTAWALIEQVKAISLKYSGVAEREQHGFNVFSIIRKSHDETAHSAFLASLLNPTGGHGQGLWFLNKFLDRAKLAEFHGDQNIRVFREYTRFRDTDNGRKRDSADIYIKSRTRAIIIENKIYAGDQRRQIERYVQVAKDESFTLKNITVIYLTLNGKKPSEGSLGNYKDSVKLIPFGEAVEQDDRTHRKLIVLLASYDTDVLSWLDTCIEHMAKYPTTRETLILYQRSILVLLGKSLVREEIMEISQMLMESGENMVAAMKVGEAFRKAKTEVQLWFWKDLMGTLTKEGFKVVDCDRKFEESKIKKYYNRGKENRLYGIKLELGYFGDSPEIGVYFLIEVDYNIYYGFDVHDKSNKSARAILTYRGNEIMGLCKKLGYEGENWPWKYPECGKVNFMEDESEVCRLANKEHREKYIDELTEEITKTIKNFRSAADQAGLSIRWSDDE